MEILRSPKATNAKPLSTGTLIQSTEVFAKPILWDTINEKSLSFTTQQFYHTLTYYWVRFQEGMATSQVYSSPFTRLPYSNVKIVTFKIWPWCCFSLHIFMRFWTFHSSVDVGLQKRKLSSWHNSSWNRSSLIEIVWSIFMKLQFLPSKSSWNLMCQS